MKIVNIIKALLKPKNGNDKREIVSRPIENLSIVTVASLTSKSDGNQDACMKRFVPEVQASIIAVADGLGSHSHSEKGSSFVVGKAVDLIEETLKSKRKEIDFDAVFQEIQDALDNEVNMLFPELPDQERLKPKKCFGTTLIVGIDYTDRFVAAYVGNGAIFNISGYFTDFPPYYYLPWNAINMLNPHTIEQGGQEALYKLFSWKGTSCAPTVLEIRKNKAWPGEIFILATDGVYSADHNIPGKDEKGAIWIPSSRTTERLYAFLKDYLLHDSFSEETLQSATETDYLSELKKNNEMNDCTTVGIVITEKCVDYFRDKNKINLSLI